MSHAENKKMIEPGDVIDLYSTEFEQDAETNVANTHWFQVIHLDLDKGKEIPQHQMPAAITVQCLSGRVTLFVRDEQKELESGNWLFLEPFTLHALTARENSSLLVTKMNLRKPDHISHLGGSYR